MQAKKAKYTLDRSPSGALTLKDQMTGEHLHRYFGPEREPREVYAEGCGIGNRAGTVVVADVGMGAGFNVLAALRAADKNPQLHRLIVHSFDTTSHGLETLLQNQHHFLQECAGLNWVPLAESLLRTGTARCERCRALGSFTFEWFFHQSDARESILHVPQDVHFHAIFYDFFSWHSHPELWTRQVMSLFTDRLTPDGIWATYSSSTAIRASILSLGLYVAEGPHVTTKLRATLAARNGSLLQEPLSPRWMERFKRSQHPFLAIETDETRRIIAERLAFHPQFNEPQILQFEVQDPGSSPVVF
jgi:tRNA U34 5-methylaminomethyl-2-thiouridine-forming methyltransferase MnmC